MAPKGRPPGRHVRPADKKPPRRPQAPADEAPAYWASVASSSRALVQKQGSQEQSSSQQAQGAAARVPKNADARRRRDFQLRHLAPLRAPPLQEAVLHNRLAAREKLREVLFAYLKEMALREALQAAGLPPASERPPESAATAPAAAAERSEDPVAAPRERPGAADVQRFVNACSAVTGKGFDELFRAYWHVVDWVIVADRMTRSTQTVEPWCPATCKIQCAHLLDSSVPLCEFSAYELERLQAAAAKHGGRDWDQVAQMVGDGRTAWQCFVQYRRTEGESAFRAPESTGQEEESALSKSRQEMDSEELARRAEELVSQKAKQALATLKKCKEFYERLSSLSSPHKQGAGSAVKAKELNTKLKASPNRWMLSAKQRILRSAPGATKQSIGRCTIVVPEGKQRKLLVGH
eukprot:TRINITY_DN13700_c0_g4_i1.p1 TRINITY_DN13700_c0_g4~~TRINITY_DN13700_c0_g4_i1.p1  ORF type:complete len:408 (-),score=87.47 TRINITY_DN13700_c0_g4_i1:66-1289(-)